MDKPPPVDWVRGHSGDKPAAAAELGVSLKTIYNMLNKWELL